MTRDQIQGEALVALKGKKKAGLAVSVGVGKTLIALKHIDSLYTENLTVLVVAPKKSIFQSWKDEAKKHNLEHLLEHISFTTYLSLNKQSIHYDVVYLDECHSLLFSHQDWLANYTGAVIGLTGTPPKYKSSEKGIMVERYCPIVYRYITDDAVKDEILNDYRIKVHMLKLNPNKSLCKTSKDGRRSWYTSELAEYNYWTQATITATSPKQQQIMRIMRMKALMEFPSKEQYAQKLFNASQEKCILFTNTQKQADKMCSHSYHSNNPQSEENLEDFKNGYITKLSCVLQLNEGVNIPNLKEGIIMHAYGNERKSSQRIGRLLRLSADQTATIHILCYVNTIDEKWVNEAISHLDLTKVEIIIV